MNVAADLHTASSLDQRVPGLSVRLDGGTYGDW